MLRRIEYIACGKAVSEALDSEHCCKKGQVVLSNDCHLILGEEFVSEGFVMPTKHGESKTFHLLQKEIKRQKNVSLKRTTLGAVGSTFLGAYVPSSIVRYLDHQQVQWSAEIRTCSVMFCNLGFTAAELEQMTEEVRLMKTGSARQRMSKDDSCKLQPLMIFTDISQLAITRQYKRFKMLLNLYRELCMLSREV